MPTEEAMDDSLRILTLGLLHALAQGQLNSIARRHPAQEVTFEHLLEIYNGRQVKAQRPPASQGPGDSALVLTALEKPIEIQLRLSREDEVGSAFATLENYLPKIIGAAGFYEQYCFLEVPYFKDAVGMSFAEFWRCWALFNGFLLQWCTVPISRANGYFWIDVVDERMERFHDLCQSGMPGGPREELFSHCLPILLTRRPDLAVTESTFRKFIDRVTFPGKFKDPLFVEQPYFVYPVGPDVIFWDCLRLPALFSATLREVNVLAHSGAAGRERGQLFELEVASAIRRAIPESSVSTAVRVNCDGQLVCEIDVAFVHNSILILIEAKNRLKPARHSFGENVESRISDFVRVLRHRDEILVQNADCIFRRFSQHKVSGALFICCTSEAEFIPTLEPALWLNPSRIPRICLAAELVEFLLAPEFASLVVRHPSFVHHPGSRVP
jgi:hypothetical protein